MSDKELADVFRERIAEASQYESCMAISTCEDSGSVELVLDTSRPYFAEWIKGEGADICLYRDHETGMVVGCWLPLMNNKLVVHHEGPIRINAGFRNGDHA